MIRNEKVHVYRIEGACAFISAIIEEIVVLNRSSEGISKKIRRLTRDLTIF